MPISLVQSRTTSVTDYSVPVSGTISTVALASAATVGNLLVAAVSSFFGSTWTSTGWTSARQGATNTNTAILWRAANAVSSWDFVNSNTAGSDGAGIVVWEFTNALTVAPQDLSNGGTGNSTSAAISGTSSLTQADEVIIFCCGVDSTGGAGTMASWTLTGDNLGGAGSGHTDRMYGAYQIASTTTAPSGTLSGFTSGPWEYVLASFKGNGAGGAPAGAGTLSVFSMGNGRQRNPTKSIL